MAEKPQYLIRHARNKVRHWWIGLVAQAIESPDATTESFLNRCKLLASVEGRLAEGYNRRGSREDRRDHCDAAAEGAGGLER